MTARLVKNVIASTPLLLDAEGVARLLSISERHFLALDATGKIGVESLYLGRRRLWRRDLVEEWVRGGCKAKREWLQERGKSDVKLQTGL